MDRAALIELLEAVRDGDRSPEEAVRALLDLPFAERGGFARVDTHRALRRGIPEVVLGLGKTPEQVVEIARALRERGQSVLVTRVAPEAAAALGAAFPTATHHATARVVTIASGPPAAGDRPGPLLVLTGGTADLPVAEEVRVCAEAFGNRVELVVDVGVAGLHRLLAVRDRIQEARAIVVVAGMEGALASVVAGLADVPVVAVPTSIGYGASFEGVTTLLAMLSSCAAGVTVVNIDNGFGAAYAATLILRGRG